MEKRRILIVDDEVEAPRLLKRLLERKCPYEVRLEHDSREALGSASGFRPDIVLLDVIMPCVDGYEVARLLRASADLQHVPIIFISAVSDPVPGFPFLSKPASIERIVATIEQQLGAAG